jgi:ABC-type sulfate transport system permease component
MTPGQAGGVLAIAAVVAGIAWLGDWIADRRGLGGFYAVAVTVTITLAGIVMAVAVVALPHSRRAGRGQ